MAGAAASTHYRSIYYHDYGDRDRDRYDAYLDALAESAGGLVHDGFDLFVSTSDKRYLAIVAWLEGATETEDCGGKNSPIPGFRGDTPLSSINRGECSACSEASSGTTETEPPCNPAACCEGGTPCVQP